MMKNPEIRNLVTFSGRESQWGCKFCCHPFVDLVVRPVSIYFIFLSQSRHHLQRGFISIIYNFLVKCNDFLIANFISHMYYWLLNMIVFRVISLIVNDYNLRRRLFSVIIINIRVYVLRLIFFCQDDASIRYSDVSFP